MIIMCVVCAKDFEADSRRFKNCGECIRQKQLMRVKNYKQKHKEEISIYNKTYKQENKAIVSEYNKKYNRDNRRQIQENHKVRHDYRMKNDMGYKMAIVLSNRLGKFYKGKSKNMIKYIGCEWEDFIKWIEFNFNPVMTWENHGKIWHVDHVIPCSFFDLSKESDRLICFDWKNQRPLLAHINVSRGSKIDEQDLFLHEIRVCGYYHNNKGKYSNKKINFKNLATKYT